MAHTSGNPPSLAPLKDSRGGSSSSTHPKPCLVSLSVLYCTPFPQPQRLKGRAGRQAQPFSGDHSLPRLLAVRVQILGLLPPPQVGPARVTRARSGQPGCLPNSHRLPPKFKQRLEEEGGREGFAPAALHKKRSSQAGGPSERPSFLIPCCHREGSNKQPSTTPYLLPLLPWMGLWGRRGARRRSGTLASKPTG